MTPRDKLAAIFKHAPWLETDGKAVHLPIAGMDDKMQLTWPELHEILVALDSHC